MLDFYDSIHFVEHVFKILNFLIKDNNIVKLWMWKSLKYNEAIHLKQKVTKGYKRSKAMTR